MRYQEVENLLKIEKMNDGDVKNQVHGKFITLCRGGVIRYWSVREMPIAPVAPKEQQQPQGFGAFGAAAPVQGAFGGQGQPGFMQQQLGQPQ